MPDEALTKQVPEVEYRSILVPVFGTPLDDDIVATAGRLADAADEPGEDAPRLEVVYVIELPLTVPLDAPPPPKKLEQAERALARARDVGEEYDTVDVHTHLIKARSVGAGIVDAARRARRRGDRDRRRAADADQGRRGAGRDRRRRGRPRSARSPSTCCARRPAGCC